MQTFKEIFGYLDYIFMTYWGFTIIDLTSIFMAGNIFSTVDNIIKLLFALAGLIFLIIRGHHYFLDKQLDRKIKKENLEKLERENENPLSKK